MSLKTDKKFLKRIISVITVLCLAVASFVISPVVLAQEDDEDEQLQNMQEQYEKIEKEIAKNKQELNKVQGQANDKKKKLASINNEINSINSQINLLDSRINTLNNNISNIENNIVKTNQTIDDLGKQIEETNTEIAETQVMMQDTRELLLGRIRENYMSGESSTLEILFSFDDISSYFTRKELMARVGENDAKLIKELTEKVKELKALEEKLGQNKTDLEQKTIELAAQKEDLSGKTVDLKSSKEVQNGKKREFTSKKQEVVSIINELDHDSAEYKAEIKKQEAEREELNRQIDAYIAAHGSKAGDTPNAEITNDGKMAWPVTFKSYVSAGYPAYSNGSAHWGIDICAVGGNSRGRPFNAAQGGKVMIAVNDGGWNNGFGNYCVIDHGDGKMTLYAHSDNIMVSVGQIVQKGQQIGIIGATGNVTGPHLHFEVRIKNADGSVSRVQPLNYVTNTTN